MKEGFLIKESFLMKQSFVIEEFKVQKIFEIENWHLILHYCFFENPGWDYDQKRQCH